MEGMPMHAEAARALAIRRDAIGLAALPHVAFDGWSQTALSRGAEAAGLDAMEALAAFPGGAEQALDWFADWADRMMAAQWEAEKAAGALPGMKTRQLVALGVRWRLGVLAPHKEALRRSMPALLLPKAVLSGLGARLLGRTADRIWIAVGDRSTDHNYYSKRLLLAAVIASVTLYWLDDDSEGQAESWLFLDRRIDDVMRGGRAIGQGIERLADLLARATTRGAASGDWAAALLTRLPSPARFKEGWRQARASRAADVR
jgi:ubiquinone biosynthesis protein COQ9